ncbi:MAG TPA: amidohydrolase family protein [Woeseiaceae bacterium]|nr:amidohydrolase family protein [Woeseiaceae bacterium]
MRRLDVIRSALAVAAVTLAATAHAEVLAVTHARVHTVGPAGTIENGTLLVEDGRILAVGSGVEVPDGARTIDASGQVVTPGLFTPMGQIGLVEVNAVRGTVDYVQRGEQFSASFDPMSAYNPRSTLVATNRIEGITHALVAPAPSWPDELGNRSTVFSGLASVVNLGDEDVLVARNVAVVANLGETGGGVAAGSRARAFMVLSTALDDARDYARNRAAYERRERRDYSLSRADMEALQGVLDGTRRLLVRVNRASDIVRAVELAEAQELEIVVVGGVEAWMVADRLAEADVPVILDALGNLPRDFDHLNARLDAASLLAEAGVRFAIGGHGAAQNHNARNITQSAGIAVANGLPWEKALAAITLAPAEIYGVAGEIGSLEPGKRADFVIWDDDPLELRSFPAAVYIGGKAVPMQSRQTLLRDRYLELDGARPPAFHDP